VRDLHGTSVHLLRPELFLGSEFTIFSQHNAAICDQRAPKTCGADQRDHSERMTPCHGSVNATFFFITDVRSTDRTRTAAFHASDTSSSAELGWIWVAKKPVS
jgi:hypothetical protein